MGDWEKPLDELRWHWGSAYLIDYLEPGVWVAQRRDDRSTLRADSPADLLDRIRADYAALPVSRRWPGPHDTKRPHAPGSRSRADSSGCETWRAL